MVNPYRRFKQALPQNAEPGVETESAVRQGSRFKYVAAASAVAGYALLLIAAGRLGWQHLSLPIIVWACLTRTPAVRRILQRWWPMLLFWLGYDSMRLLEPLLLARVAVESPFRWESWIFRSPEGTIWPFFFTRWLERSGDSFWPQLLSRFTSLVYLSHVFMIPLIFFAVWMRDPERLFPRLLWSFTALHVLTVAIWLGYPAAPPWWVYENGFLQPTIMHSMPAGLASGSTLSTLFQFNANRFAAIPSLHGAYPLLLMLVLAWNNTRSRWILLSGGYAATMWFACIFLNQHFIIDLILGAALVPFALFFGCKSRTRSENSAQIETIALT